MKNFSEATATKIPLKITLDLRPVGCPSVCLQIGKILLFDDTMISPTHIEHDHELLAPLTLSLELRGKQYSEQQETAVIVERLLIDNISMVPEMTHRFAYQNDHGFTDPTAYLGFNGTWQLDTGDCFYRWWHQQSGQGWMLAPTT